MKCPPDFNLRRIRRSRLEAGWNKRRLEKEFASGTSLSITYHVSKSLENLPPGTGAALVMKVVNANGDVIGLVRPGAGGQQ